MPRSLNPRQQTLVAETRLALGNHRVVGKQGGQHVLRWLDITDGVEDALDQLERVAYTVEGIMLKHA